MENEKVMEKKEGSSSCDDDGRRHKEHDKEEEDDERKMDKFYELITSFREARNRLRQEIIINNINTNNDEKQREKMKTKKRKSSSEGHEEIAASWVPSFELEDFTSQVEFRGIPTSFPAPAIPCNNHKEDHTRSQVIHGLNLNLTL